jgi:hypothetical protein
LITSVDIAVLTLGAIAIVNMALRFDSLIVNGAIAAITTVLSISKYLKSRETVPE